MKIIYTCEKCGKTKKGKRYPKKWESVYPKGTTICDKCAPQLDAVRDEMADASKLAADSVWQRWLDA